jgi:hypothetical protein
MSKKPAPPLVEACIRLDEALAAHGLSTRELGRLALDSRKGVDKAETTLARLSHEQDELGAAMQAFVGVLSAARVAQQADAERAQARALELVSRKRELAGLDTRLELVAGAVKAVRVLLDRLKDGGGPGTAEATGKLEEIADLAQGVADDARAADFADVADEAHGLRQQLDAVVKRAQTLAAKLPQA